MPTSKQRLVAGVLERHGELAERVVDITRADIASYARLAPAVIAPTTSRSVQLVLGALRDGRPLTADDVRAFQEYGQLRAHQAIPLVDVLSSWRIVVREVLDALTSAGRVSRVRDGIVLELTRELLAVVDQASLAFTGGHRDIELEHARHDQQRRGEFTRGLLLGTLSPADLTRLAQQYGLDTGREYRAFRVRADDVGTNRKLEQTLNPLLTTTIDGDLAGFVDQARPAELTVPVGFGPPEALAQLDRSFRMAGRMLAAGHAYGRSGVCDVDALGLLPAVLADADLGDELVRRYITPLMPTGSVRLLTDTVACYLDHGMRFDRTAKELFVHPNTIRYRLGRFEELTGADLRRAHIAAQVWWAIARWTGETV